MITDRKTSRSSTSRQSSRKPINLQTLDQLPEANFVTDFLKFYEDSEVFPSPEFHITGTAGTPTIILKNSKANNENQRGEEKSNEFFEQTETSKSGIVTVFNLIYNNQVDLDAPKDFRCRGFEVDSFTLDALNNCVKKFSTITTLKLQRCSITASGIAQISEILYSESGRSIKDLNLDGNPNIKQNYYLLCAPGTSLLHLSLKLCGINDDGVAKIASNLSHRDEPHAPKLIAINLANNHISENGGKFIGNMLRTNSNYNVIKVDEIISINSYRSLRSLTLTGNRINDSGAECIIEQLSTFALTQTEIVEKRRRKLNRLKLCQEKIENLSREASTPEFLEAEGKDRGNSNRVLKKRRASSRQLISNSSSSSVNQSTPIIVQSLEEKAEAMIPVETHPLVKDIVPVNGTLICHGNYKLEHLNLSYNKIGGDTLRRIIECVKKQMLTPRNVDEKGLQYIEVEGNEFGKSSDLVLQLNGVIRRLRSS